MDDEAATPQGASEQPRAEELIAEIYRQRTALEDAGERPASVVMTMEQYRRIQQYHAALGETPAPAFDYISRYSVLGLSVLIDNGAALEVTIQPAGEPSRDPKPS